MSGNELSSLGDSPPPANADPDEPPSTISSEELLKGRRELFIEHDGQLYRLRVTSRGKLYLTK